MRKILECIAVSGHVTPRLHSDFGDEFCNAIREMSHNSGTSQTASPSIPAVF